MKFRITALSLLFVLLNLVSQAQNPARTTIKGVLQDTLHEVIPFATVMLLNPADSALVNYSSSNDKGEFAFNNVKNSAYLLKVSHMSYLPLQILIKLFAAAIHDLQVVNMKPISQMLMEVVIKAAKAPLRIKGDTVEYDASTF
ncbi:MAG: carboxypeptidase-like regulatory domain-containing protein [Bacteroidales bacterium]